MFEPKLTPEQRTEIAVGQEPAKETALKYGVTTQTVYDIRQKARNEAARAEREANTRTRNGTIRDLSEWDDMVYRPESAADRLHVPQDIIPEGFEYQWCAAEVNNQPFAQRISTFEKQGWKPVPAARHEGLWTPSGSTGGIMVDGLLLMERPKSWCDRARAYQEREAKQIMEIKRAQLTGGDIPGVTFDTQHPSARKVTGMRSQYEQVTGVSPKYDYVPMPDE